MSFVDHQVGFNFVFGLKVQIGPYPPQFGSHLAHFTTRHVLDIMSTWPPCMDTGRPHLYRRCHLDMERPSPLSASLTRSLLPWRLPSLSLALGVARAQSTDIFMATDRAPWPLSSLNL